MRSAALSSRDGNGIFSPAYPPPRVVELPSANVYIVLERIALDFLEWGSRSEDRQQWYAHCGILGLTLLLSSNHRRADTYGRTDLT